MRRTDIPESTPVLRLLRALREQLADSVRTAPPEFTRRRVPGRVRFPGKVTAVVGMRRAGKTTFLHQLRQERLEHGTPRQRLPYVSFEDDRLADLEATDLGLLLSEYDREFPDADGT
ncbi:MAG: AAA family ATPase, partial [Gammaproteobacteria bacterium]|nr:AAA family ATPase [Gammaproteobacteria bacterium]